MKSGVRLALVLSLVIAAGRFAVADTRATHPAPQLPIAFAPNIGQAGPGVEFVGRGHGYEISLTSSGPRLAVNSAMLGVDFVGGNPGASLVPQEKLPGTANYFVGSNAARWRTGVPTYRSVRAANIYAGVDAVYYGSDGLLEYDLVVAPRVDPAVIRLAFHGASSLKMTAAGELAMIVNGREVRQRRPVIYQDLQSGRRRIEGRYVADERGIVRFAIGDYDRSRPLIIDPVLVYSSYSGGPVMDTPADIAVDVAGSAYLAGRVGPLAGGAGDATLIKIDPTGSFAVYSIYFGGSDDENASSVAVDSHGAAYVSGYTRSRDFPTRSAFQRTFGGGGFIAAQDAFVAKFSSQGSLVYSTYLGGSSDETANDLAITANGEAIVVGTTTSANFPVANALQPFRRGSADAFVARLAPSGSQLIYSTYLGGSDIDSALAGAVDAAGNVYISGSTVSGDFPVVDPFQAKRAGGIDMFVAKLTADGSAIAYATYLGGTADDFMHDIAVTRDGLAVVCGETTSTDLPTTNAAQPEINGFVDAFVVLLEAGGSTAAYATYWGGSDTDSCDGTAIDDHGQVHVTGRTDSSDFPLVDALQPNPGGNGDAFVTTIAASGTVVSSSYFGGSAQESGSAITYDPSGALYVTGYTESADLPTTPAAFQRTPGGAFDGFVAKFGAMCGAEVTTRLDIGSILDVKIPLTPWRLQLVLMRNHSAESVGGPLTLVLTDLHNAAFAGSPYTTSCIDGVASPFTIVTGGADGVLAPGELSGQWLLFYEPGAVLSYVPRVLSGVPGR